MANIPIEFHSLETGTAFENCCDCGCELLESAQMYMIQKCFSNGECAMEFALCDRCKEILDGQISSESKEAMYDFLFDNTIINDQKDHQTATEAMQQIEECLTCSKKKSVCKTFTYSGLFIGKHLIPGPLPMMICEDCQGSIAENMSDHTRDVKNKFYEENFPGPPSEVDLPTSKPMFL